MSAQYLADLGFAFVSVAALNPDLSCSCPKREHCAAPGKHPSGRNWMRSALLHRARPGFRVPACARLAPITSYGVIPPKGSRLVVIDRDNPDVLLPLPGTFEVHRASAHPRKGHYYFLLADDIEEAEVPRAFAGGEVAVAASRFVVGPGSRHVSGDLYESNDAPVGYADRDLIEALRALKVVRRGQGGEVEAVLGSRHAWLTSQARKLRGWGLDPDEITDRLRDLNETVCEPPLTDREFADVERAVEWAVRTISPDAPVNVRRSKAARRASRGWSR